MREFKVPTKAEVSEGNQAIFDKLNGMLGFVPNLYAYYAKSETALGDYLGLQNRKTTLNNKEKEIVNLVTSQVNGCEYCLAAHTAIGKMNGFSDEQIVAIRKEDASFDDKFAALATFTADTVRNRGKATEASKEALFAAGYTEVNMIDITLLIGDKTISNYMHNLTGFAVDFPEAPSL